jgi:diguanylate cyclase (GGDEF)-like protein
VDRAAAAQERAQLEVELIGAHTDDLTGAHRREVGRVALQLEIDRARRTGKGFVLAFVDVDDLKGVNDREGHAAGDNVLATLVRILRANLRSFDPVVRYGGDEFVCGLGGMSIEDARRRFEQVDRRARDEAGTGISVGLAALGTDETIDELTDRADAELLAAKRRRHDDAAGTGPTPG